MKQVRWKLAGLAALTVASMPGSARDLVWTPAFGLPGSWDAVRVVGGFAESNWEVVDGAALPVFPESGDRIGFRQGATVNLNGDRQVKSLAIQTTESLSFSGGKLRLEGINRDDVAGSENNHAISIPLEFTASDARVDVKGSGFLNLSGPLTGDRLLKYGSSELVLTHPSVDLNAIEVWGGVLRLASTPTVTQDYPTITLMNSDTSLLVDTPIRVPAMIGFAPPAGVVVRNAVLFEAEYFSQNLGLSGATGARARGAVGGPTLLDGARISLQNITFELTGWGSQGHIEMGPDSTLRVVDPVTLPGSPAFFSVTSRSGSAVIDTNGHEFHAGTLAGQNGGSLRKTGAGTLVAANVAGLSELRLEQGNVSLPTLHTLGGVTFAGSAPPTPELRLSADYSGITDTALRFEGPGVIDVAAPAASATTIGALSGSPGSLFSKRGPGKLALHGPAAGFGGSIIVEAGELEFQTTGPVDPLALVITGGLVRLAGADTIDPDTQISLSSGGLSIDAPNPLRHLTLGQGTLKGAAGLILTPGGAGLTHATAGAPVDQLDLPVSLVTLPGESPDDVRFNIGVGETLRLAGELATPSAGLRKVGPGALVLAANNFSLNRGIRLEEGTLAAAMPFALNHVASPGIQFVGGTLRLDQDLIFLPAIELAGAGQRVLDLNGHSGTNGKPITGPAGLRITGAGLFSLAGSNTFSGGLTIADGAFVATLANPALGAPASPVTFDGGGLSVLDPLVLPAGRTLILGPGGGTFEIARDKTLTVDTFIQGSGKLTLAGPGTAILNINNLHTGGTELRGALAQIASSGALGSAASSAPVQLSAGGHLRVVSGAPMILGRSFELSGAGTIETASPAAHQITGFFGGAGTFTKTGAGSLALTGGIGGLDFDVRQGHLSVRAANTLVIEGRIGVAEDATFAVTGATAFASVVLNERLELAGGTFDADLYAAVFRGDVLGHGTIAGAGTANRYFATLDPGISGPALGSLFATAAMEPVSLVLAGGLHELTGSSRLILDITPTAAERVVLLDNATLKLGGALELRFSGAPKDFIGQAFTLFAGGTLAGAFSTVEFSGLPAGFTIDQDTLFTAGSLSVTAVPLPASAVLFISGLAVLAAPGARRRRRNEAA